MFLDLGSYRNSLHALLNHNSMFFWKDGSWIYYNEKISILDLLNLLNHHIISILMPAGSVLVGTILSFWHVSIDCYQASRQIMYEDLVLPSQDSHHPREAVYLVVAQHLWTLLCLGLNSHCPLQNWVPTMMDQEPTISRGSGYKSLFRQVSNFTNSSHTLWISAWSSTRNHD